MLQLLDTHLLLWAAYTPERLSARATAVIEAPEHSPAFSAASIWEVAITAALGRADFTADARMLRRGLLDNGYAELPITSAHAAAVADLPALHQDPFDRILVAQARSEGIPLFTSDARVAAYGSPVELV